MKDISSILEKCSSEEQREELLSLLKACDKYKVKYEIGKVIDWAEEVDAYCSSLHDVDREVVEAFQETLKEQFKDPENNMDYEFELYFPETYEKDKSYKSDTGWLIMMGRTEDNKLLDLALIDWMGNPAWMWPGILYWECEFGNQFIALKEGFVEYINKKYFYP